GREIENPVDVCEPVGGRAGGAGVDVLDQSGTARRLAVFLRRGCRHLPVAPPQLLPVRAVGGGEGERAGDGREDAGVRSEAEVLDHDRGGGGAVALPELTIRAVEDCEEERPVHGRQVVQGGVVAEVLDHHRAGGGTVALPELPVPRTAVLEIKEE